MVGFQIIDLFSEQNRPQILAEEFDDIEIIVEARPIAREPALRTRGVSNPDYKWACGARWLAPPPQPQPAGMEEGNGAAGKLPNTFLRDPVLPGTPASRGGSMLTL